LTHHPTFLQGCSILDSVATAHEIISTCAKYNWSTFFLKIDFAKAFDTIDWAFLLKVLHARVFGDRWCGWIQSLLCFGFSSVLVNSLPGTPFRCKRGLRQWDPLSPYLFIIGVNVLSRILKLASEEGFVHKVGPWNPRVSCLQYTDDTIMLLPPDLVSIKRVKLLIYIFKLFFGLSIDFHKSSIYQLGPPCLDLDLSQVSCLLHCRLGSFPFTYLGLPP